MYVVLHVEYLLFLSYYHETSIFSTDVPEISSFVKRDTWEVELFNAEGQKEKQTDGQT